MDFQREYETYRPSGENRGKEPRFAKSVLSPLRVS
jgi:hypothetical protein